MESAPPLAPAPQTLLLERMGPSGGLHLHLDFDGTLVPIQADPAACHPDADLLALLSSLVRLPGVAVAILSGRSLADLQARLPVPGLALAGNHGLEIAAGGLRWRHPAALALVPLLGRLAARARERLEDIPGAAVEDKTLTLSLHGRRVPPPWRPLLRRRLADLEAEWTARLPIRLRRGRQVLEVLPAVAWGKASAARRLMGEGDAHPLFYAGDDLSDEAVFRAFPGALTVRVGAGTAGSAARHALADCSALRSLLRAFLQLRGGDAHPFAPESQALAGGDRRRGLILAESGMDAAE